MKPKIILTVITLAFMALICCHQAYSEVSPKTYIIAIVSEENYADGSSDVYAAFMESVADLLARETGYKFKVKRYVTYGGIKSALLKKEAAFGFIDRDIVFAYEFKNTPFEYLASYSIGGRSARPFCLYVKKDSEVKSIYDLKGKSLTTMMSDYAIMNLALENAGIPINPDLYFNIRSSNDTENAIASLLNGRIDSASLPVDYVEMLRILHPEYAEIIRSVSCVGEFANPPLMARQGLPEDMFDSVKKTLLEAGERSSGAGSFEVFRKAGLAFIPVKQEDYSNREMLHRKAERDRQQEGRQWKYQQGNMMASPLHDFDPKNYKTTKDTSVLFELSNRYESVGRIDEAISASRQAFKLAEKMDDNAYRYLVEKTEPIHIARLMMRQGRYDEAEDVAKKAIEHDKTNSDAPLTLANIYRQTGRSSAAIETLERYFADGGAEWSAAYLELARALVDAGRLEEAEKAYLKAEPLFYETGTRNAFNSELLNFYDNAMFDLDRKEQNIRRMMNPWNEDEYLLYSLANAIIRKGPEYEMEAVELLKNYYKHTNESPEAMAYAELGSMALILRNDKNAAYKYYRRSRQYNSICKECLTLNWAMLDHDARLERCGKATLVNPDHPGGYVCLSETYFEKKEYKKSLEYFTKLHILEPNWLVFPNEIVAYFNVRGREEGMRRFKQAVEENRVKNNNSDSNEQYMIELQVEALSCSGEDDLAIEKLGEYAKKWKYGFLAYHEMAGCMAERGNYERAAELEKVASEKSPFNANFHYRLGAYYAKLGNNTKAEKEYLRAIELSPRNPLFITDLGTFYQNNGRKDDADKMFKRAGETDAYYRIDIMRDSIMN